MVVKHRGIDNANPMLVGVSNRYFERLYHLHTTKTYGCVLSDYYVLECPTGTSAKTDVLITIAYSELLRSILFKESRSHFVSFHTSFL